MIANALTCLRIICCAAILFTPSLSSSFFLLYTVAGITDMADGFIARLMKSETLLGKKLDTFADFIMFSVCFYKLFSFIKDNTWICILILIIGILKTLNIIIGYKVNRKITTVHSPMNKITGTLLFILPYVIKNRYFEHAALFASAVAAAAALSEGWIIIGKKDEKHNN